MEQLLKKILITNSANNQVIKHFVTSLRSATSASLKAIASSSYQSRLALLRWYCIFLENYTKRDLPVFPILLSELSSLLASFVDLPEGARDNAFHRFTATIKVKLISCGTWRKTNFLTRTLTSSNFTSNALLKKSHL